MKSETFVASKDVYDEWAGDYVVRTLTGADALDIEEQIFKHLRKKNITNITMENYPFSLERRLGLAKSVLRDGKEIFGVDIEDMPQRLYKILMGLYQRLNEPSQDEATFLSKAL